MTVIQPTVGLRLSIGEIVKRNGKEFPQKIDHFRPKPGQLDQYQDEANSFVEQFGNEPQSVPILLLSDEIGDVLDVRPLAWGSTQLKARGVQNLSELPEAEFVERLFAWTEEMDVFGQGDAAAAATHKLAGPDDPKIAKNDMKVYGTLSFAIPNVTSLTTVAQITTTSPRSIKNLYKNLHTIRDLTGGRMIGVPVKLRMRKQRTHFKNAKGEKMPTEFYELLVECPLTFPELYSLVAQRREAIGPGPQIALPAPDYSDPSVAAEFRSTPDDETPLEGEIVDEGSNGDIADLTSTEAQAEAAALDF